MKKTKQIDRLDESRNTFGAWGECTIDWMSMSYSVAEIALKSKEYPVIECPLDVIGINLPSPCENTLLSFAIHIKKVLAADIKYPIILAPDGFVLDGRHRIVKHLLEGKKSIKVIRLHQMPSYISKKDD